jgi:hypothetical protein
MQNGLQDVAVCVSVLRHTCGEHCQFMLVLQQLLLC